MNDKPSRMDYRQHQAARRLVHECCNYDEGNCLLLDDGEPCVCVQSISYSLMCRWFRVAVLPLDGELAAALLYRGSRKRCAVCGAAFVPKSNRGKYCPGCAGCMKKRKAAERKRKQRQKCHALGYTGHIDNLFRASNYLVSPLNDPSRFIQGEYFLTQAQEQVKKSVLSGVDSAFLSAYFHITGKPGTGKTLLLYDIAKTLSKNGKTVIIHCGKLSSGQYKIRNEIDNLNIVSVSELRDESFSLSDYTYILVDESHRIYTEQFDAICDSANKNDQICIFSSDPEQVLSASETRNDIVAKIEALHLDGQFTLSEKIRTNRELHSFIMCMKDLNHRPKVPMDYSSVVLNYPYYRSHEVV